MIVHSRARITILAGPLEPFSPEAGSHIPGGRSEKYLPGEKNIINTPTDVDTGDVDSSKPGRLQVNISTRRVLIRRVRCKICTKWVFISRVCCKFGSSTCLSGEKQHPQRRRHRRRRLDQAGPPPGTEMCSGSEAGSYLGLIDACITQLRAQGPSRTCNESKEEEEEASRF